MFAAFERDEDFGLFLCTFECLVFLFEERKILMYFDFGIPIEPQVSY